jgi:hypothetical protein
MPEAAGLGFPAVPERWWDGEPGEIFWMEITDREDLGTDLHAPGQTETGRESWSYAFVREVREGDVILHYRARPINAIALRAPWPRYALHRSANDRVTRRY